MLALIFPGQGSQTPGMLTPWLDDEQRKVLAKWSLHIDLDLERLGSTATAEEIKETANAQPLIVAAGILGATSLKNLAPDIFQSSFKVAAGHSVGEITAAAISEVLPAATALELVRKRGLAMAKAASQADTGMSAVLGGDRIEILNALREVELVAANENGAGQIVAAGSLDALDKLAANPPAGSRVRALAVAGAFHTSYMQSAVGEVSKFAEALISESKVSNPKVQLLSNRDGQVVTDGKDVITRIINQIANPVRWDLCMESLIQLGVTGAIELPPAGTLVGLIKRAAPSIETFALKNPEDLNAAIDFAKRHNGN